MAKTKCDILAGTKKQLQEKGKAQFNYIHKDEKTGKCTACAVGYLLLEAGFPEGQVAVLDRARNGKVIGIGGLMRGEYSAEVAEQVRPMQETLISLGFNHFELNELQCQNDTEPTDRVVRYLDSMIDEGGC